MSTNIEENYHEVIPEIRNYSMSEIDLFVIDIGAHIDKVVSLVDLVKLKKTKKITSVWLSSFHYEVMNGIQFFN